MDKETRKKVEQLLKTIWYSGKNESQIFDFFELVNREGWVSKVVSLIGYRKIEGEPPLLSNQEIEGLCIGVLDGFDSDDIKKGAVAQRDSDIKWYKGEEITK